MIPGPWVALVLVLAAFRVTRLIGWDTLPFLERARAWATGEERRYVGDVNAMNNLTGDQLHVETTHRRPSIAKLLECPWCLGFWVSILVYLAWVFAPTEAIYGATPFALSAAVGFTTRWLDQ